MRNRNLVAAAVAAITAGALAAPAPASAESGCAVPRFGHTGYAMCGTKIMDVNWNSSGADRLETFVIGPNRAIYHIWQGADGWVQMPGGGRADDTYNAYWSGTGDRNVTVYVNGKGYYCTTDPAGSAGWNGWRACT